MVDGKKCQTDIFFGIRAEIRKGYVDRYSVSDSIYAGIL